METLARNGLMTSLTVLLTSSEWSCVVVGTNVYLDPSQLIMTAISAVEYFDKKLHHRCLTGL